MKRNKNYFSFVCDRTINIKSKNIHPKSLTHNQNEKSIRNNHTSKNSNFFDIDKIFNDYIANHNKKFDSCLFKWEFKLVFNNFTPHIKTEFYQNTTIITLKRYLFFELIILLEEDVFVLISIKWVFKLLVIKEIWIINIILFNQRKWLKIN